MAIQTESPVIIGHEDPFDRVGLAARAPRGTSDDVFGAFSIEKFATVSGLSYTHEDAQGWYDYLARFATPNFWYRDGGVQVWAYEQTYDNWQDTYGMDAVNAVYHSGHGNMSASGVFEAPLGGVWDGRSWAYSTNMRLGDEQANYIFWSTCLSLRVLDGHNPINTWHNSNLGFRMLFGFETTSVDDPNYGKFFWEQWNRPQPFWQAWCDASWRISHSQAPSVVAVGADQADATNRLWNERLLYWEHVPRNWYQWVWYNAARGVGARRERSLELPDEALIAELRPVEMSAPRVRDLAERFGVEGAVPDLPAGTALRIGDGNGNGPALGVRPNGGFEIRFGAPTLDEDQRAPRLSRAHEIAGEAIRQYGLDEDVELAFDQVRHTVSAGGSTEDREHVAKPRVVETTVQYRQVVNGLPTVGADQGLVQITIGNDGQLTRLVSTVRPVERLSDRPLTTTASPGDNGSIARPRSADAGPERLLAEAWRDKLGRLSSRGVAAFGTSPVPGTTEIGYELGNGTARLVARREVEVDFGDGLATRYVVTAPILD
jgi:uncharacterized protein DUF6345